MTLLPARLAAGALRRHGVRTALAVLGVAVSAALLLDMVMLATGMRESFRELILVSGFQLRLTPKGTLPFDTEATIDSASQVAAIVRRQPGVVATSPILGASIHVPLDGRVVTAFAIGIDPRVQGDYDLTAGRDLLEESDILVNERLLHALGRRLGDTIDVAAGYDAQLRRFAGRRRLRIGGIARFHYFGADQNGAAVRLATLQGMGGAGWDERRDRVSLFMVKTSASADVERVRTQIARAVPWVSVISTAGAMAQLDDRLSYFRQLAFILGAISLVVGFLLVTTLVTVSVNQRIGEIAVLRAIGVSTPHVVQQIVLESVGLSVPGAIIGLGLGLATARYLNRILSDFPGLPANFDFFRFQPRSAWISLGMLSLAGVVASVYPAWRAATRPVATTLREEAVA